jgi:hypothetical protein
MKKYFRIFILLGGYYIVASCMEIKPITPPEHNSGIGNGTSCQAPPISQNIVGTWHFESTYNSEYISNNTITTGTISFDNHGVINDPDSLFENTLASGAVLSKTYNPDLQSTLTGYSGKLFVVYQKTAKGQQTTYFTLVDNDCKRVHLRLLQSGNNGIGFVLTRL